MKKNTIAFLLLLCLTTVLIACEDDPVSRGAPIAANMMTYWNAESINKRILTAAIFEHDDHDDILCANCHKNGDESPVTLPAGSVINGVTVQNNAAHNFCVSCHNGKKDAPILSYATCNKCHIGSTSPYSGGEINLIKSWGRFFPTGTTFNRPKVMLSHFSHKNYQCVNCHTGSPSNIDGSYPITPVGISTPEATADSAKDKTHAYCDSCHTTVTNAPLTTANCGACHK